MFYNFYFGISVANSYFHVLNVVESRYPAVRSFRVVACRHSKYDLRDNAIYVTIQ